MAAAYAVGVLLTILLTGMTPLLGDSPINVGLNGCLPGMGGLPDGTSENRLIISPGLP